MRLGELLGPLDEAEILALAREIVPAWQEVFPGMLARSVESVLQPCGAKTG